MEQQAFSALKEGGAVVLALVAIFGLVYALKVAMHCITNHIGESTKAQEKQAIVLEKNTTVLESVEKAIVRLVNTIDRKA